MRRPALGNCHSRALLAIALVALGPLGCRASLRLAPAVTVDTSGKAGFQAIAAFGLMAISDGANGRGFAIASGGGAIVRDQRAAAIIESAIDYYVVPTPNDRPYVAPALGSPSVEPHPSESGPAARAGVRLGIRPEGGKWPQSAGAAGAVAWRFGASFWHLVGVEARADYVGASSAYGVFAVGPHYELASPALKSFGR